MEEKKVIEEVNGILDISKKIYEEANSRIIDSINISDNIINGAIIKVNQDMISLSSKMFIKFSINGKEYIRELDITNSLIIGLKDIRELFEMVIREIMVDIFNKNQNEISMLIKK